MMLEDFGTDRDALTSSVEAVVDYEVELATARRARIFKHEDAREPFDVFEKALDFGELVAMSAVALESLVQLGWAGLEGLADPRVRDRFRHITGMDVSDLGPRVQRLERWLGLGPKPSQANLDVLAAYQEFLQVARSSVETRSFDVMKETAIGDGNAERANRCHFVAGRLRQLVARSEVMNPILTTLGMAYAEGRMSLAEVGTATGLAPEDLVPELERLGYHRQLEAIRLSPEERRARLQQLASAQGPRRYDLDHVRRDVIATHRIEGIDARGLLTTRA